MILFVAAALFLLLFSFSFWRDRRRFRNGIYLTLGLLFLAGGMLVQAPAMSPVMSIGSAFVIVLIGVFIPLFVAALAVFLVANGVTMIRREGRRLGNLLSLLAGLGMFGFVFTIFTVLGIRSAPLWTIMFSVTLVIGYVSFLFFCYLLYSAVYSRVRERGEVNFIVVLGSGLLRSKVPPLLASRLDRGISEFNAEWARGGRPAIITSGGQGPDEELPESRAMADYLISRGVPEDQIILEDRSRTTEQNLNFSREIMERMNSGYRCTVVTNNYHAFRAALMARHAGVRGQVIGSPTALYYWPSATIREFAAVFMDHRVVNFGICGILAMFAPGIALVDSL